MTEIIRETTTVKERNANTGLEREKIAETEVLEENRFHRVVNYVLGALEILLTSRLLLKLLGANPGNAFVAWIYTVSQPFVLPFKGMFHRVVTAGVETVSVLEPATIVGMLVYAVLAWGIMELVEALGNSSHQLHRA